MADQPDIAAAIASALRAKRDGRDRMTEDIEALEASLVADIEAFDLDAVERQTRHEQMAIKTSPCLLDPSLNFPDIVPNRKAEHAVLDTRIEPEIAKPAETRSNEVPFPQINLEGGGSSLLDQLKAQADVRQREQHSAQAERNTAHEALDQALKKVFFYLHDVVQQLNIIKPSIPRDFLLVEKFVFRQLAWTEGFVDYRSQSQSAGALVELVSFSYRINGKQNLLIERDGPSIDRFRTVLFDYGLPFNCKEYRNERRHLERADFHVRAEIGVSARWRADFDKGVVILETRNLERLGAAIFTIRPTAVDQSLLDDFGRLVLGQPNRFRELARR